MKSKKVLMVLLLAFILCASACSCTVLTCSALKYPRLKQSGNSFTYNGKKYYAVFPDDEIYETSNYCYWYKRKDISGEYIGRIKKKNSYNFYFWALVFKCYENDNVLVVNAGRNGLYLREGYSLPPTKETKVISLFLDLNSTEINLCSYLPLNFCFNDVLDLGSEVDACYVEERNNVVLISNNPELFNFTEHVAYGKVYFEGEPCLELTVEVRRSLSQNKVYIRLHNKFYAFNSEYNAVVMEAISSQTDN